MKKQDEYFILNYTTNVSATESIISMKLIVELDTCRIVSHPNSYNKNIFFYGENMNIFQQRLLVLTDPVRLSRERRFMEEFILSGNPTIIWKKGIQLKDIPIFTARCRNFECRMVGLEIHPDSPFPIYCFVYEEYNIRYMHNWFEPAIKELHDAGVNEMIMPSVKIPSRILQTYLL
ncbi:MAG: hypothetical protein IPI23_00935 [Bacteroidetes bacterium]|nr:hypothetical protein [Bacteroidota bacterium]